MCEIQTSLKVFTHTCGVESTCETYLLFSCLIDRNKSMSKLNDSMKWKTILFKFRGIMDQAIMMTENFVILFDFLVIEFIND